MTRNHNAQRFHFLVSFIKSDWIQDSLIFFRAGLMGFFRVEFTKFTTFDRICVHCYFQWCPPVNSPTACCSLMLGSDAALEWGLLLVEALVLEAFVVLNLGLSHSGQFTVRNFFTPSSTLKYEILRVLISLTWTTSHGKSLENFTTISIMLCQWCPPPPPIYLHYNTRGIEK